jgi:protein-arginine deiminase
MNKARTGAEFLGTREMLRDSDCVADQEVCQQYIDGVRNTLKTELGLTDANFVEIPAIFYWAPSYEEAWAWIPNLVNLLVCGERLVVAKPFGPREPNQTDVFEEYVEDSVETIGLDARFVDDWDTYHTWIGEIHCGTNVKRSVPATKWWD